MTFSKNVSSPLSMTTFPLGSFFRFEVLIRVLALNE